MPTLQIGSGASAPPKSQWENIWQEILDAFFRADGFFAKLGIIFDAFYALIRASLKWATENLKKTAWIVVVATAIIWFLIQIYRYNYFGLTAWGILIAAGVWWSIKKMGDKKTITISGMPVARSTCIVWLIVIAMILTGIGLAIYYASWTTIGLTVGAIVLILLFTWMGFTAYNNSNVLTSIVSWIWRTETFLIVGIAVLNGLFWTIAPETWKHIWKDQARFWVINLGSWVALILLLIPAKDGDKDQTTKQLIARKFATVIFGGVFIALISMSWKANVKSTGDDQSGLYSKTVTDSSYSAPMEIALRAICECESGCQQFNEDGTLKWNREGSTAVGKYQILASIHEERAKKMGFDIRTETGNEGYARSLFTEFGTKPWEFDGHKGGGRACWGSKLKAYTWGGEVVVMTWIAPVGKWSNEIPLPRTGHRGGQTSIDELGKKATILWNNEIEDEVPRPPGVKPKNPSGTTSFRLKSREAEPIPIVVKFF